MAIERPVFYRRKLPHLQPPLGSFFVTYRLAGSLPIAVIEELKQEYYILKQKKENQSNAVQDELYHQYFLEFDRHLDRNLNEPHWLRVDVIRNLVLDSLQFNHGRHYHLWAACIMSNHVHLLLSTLDGAPSLDVIMQNHKKFTALHANRHLGRQGQFWVRESYDRMIRNEAHFHNVVHYILQNPIEAALARRWQDYPGLYLDKTLRKDWE